MACGDEDLEQLYSSGAKLEKVRALNNKYEPDQLFSQRLLGKRRSRVYCWRAVSPWRHTFAVVRQSVGELRRNINHHLAVGLEVISSTRNISPTHASIAGVIPSARGKGASSSTQKKSILAVMVS